MKTFARMAAILGLVGVFGASAIAAPPAPPAPPMAGAKAPAKGTMVKGYTRKGKNGKMVTVKPHMRVAKTTAKTHAAKTKMVKGYTRKDKNGKMVTVKGYTRKTPAKKAAAKTPAAAPKM